MVKKYRRVWFSSMIVLVISLLIIRNIDRNHWTVKTIDDRTNIPLTSTVSSIQEGLFIADKKAWEWREEAVLANVSMLFQGKEAINSKKGEMRYEYYVRNNSIFGYRDAVCWVQIDLNKQAITRFETLGGQQLASDPVDISKWNLDIEGIFRIVERTEEYKIIDKYDNPKIILHMGEKYSFVSFFSESDAYDAEERIEFVINNATGKIDNIKKLPKLTVPR